jgi:hypothetical protein
MNAVRSSNDLVNVSIRCRCNSLITYQCSGPLLPSSQSETGMRSEIPLFCYSCGRLVTKLYLDSTIKAPQADAEPISNPNSSVTLNIHPQTAMNQLLGRAQVSSLVSPPTVQPISSMNLGFSTLHPTASGLPAIDVSDHIEGETASDSQVVESPSARSGTILPMLP